MANKAPLRRAALSAGSLIAFVAVWQLVCALFRVDPWILPSPYRIARAIADDFPRLMNQLGFTLRLALEGVGLGVVFGVAAALLFHLIPGVRAALTPLIIVTQNVPLIALGPLLIVWFGFGLMPKLILLVLVCFFPVAWSMLAGLGQAESQLREYLAMIGASRREVLRRLELPASLPAFFTGLKLTAAYSVSAVIVAEWLGGSDGIGHYLVLKEKGFDTPGVFAAIVCIVALALAFYGAAAGLERLAIRWKPRRTEAKGGDGA